jgi:tetratricopeptide (TPR) repeat protein
MDAPPAQHLADSTPADLLEGIQRRRVVVVVGAGVSVAATAGTSGEAVASWKGLLNNGIEHCIRFGRPPVPVGWAERRRADLDSGDLDSLLLVADSIASRLGAPGGGEFRYWLKETVGSLRPTSPSVLKALRDLRLPMVTTNFDGLLERVTGLPAVTWRQDAQVEWVLRGDEAGIVHLHGHWQQPESVVLGRRGYADVFADPHAQAVLRALRTLRMFLFVGCGSTLEDLNFGALLRWSREVFPGSPFHHYRLCLDSEVAGLYSLHSAEERIYPLAYGPGYDRLAPFLRALSAARAGRRRRLRELSLGSATVAEPGPLAAAWAAIPPSPTHCFGRQKVISDLVETLCAERPLPCPILGLAGVGKTTLALVALHEERVKLRFGARRLFVRCDGATTADGLLRAIAAALGLDPGPAMKQRLFRELSAAAAVVVLDNAETPWDRDRELAEEFLAELAALPRLALVALLRGGHCPGGLPWREAIHLQPLAIDEARGAFLAVAGKRHREDPFLDRLLIALEGLPLAITLLAHQAKALPALGLLWERWTDECSELLKRADGLTPDTNLEVSVALSLRSPRLTAEGRRLASLLALLPDGAAAQDLPEICAGEATEAAVSLWKTGILVATGLAAADAPRIRLLAPIREVLSRLLPPAAVDHERMVSHYLGLAVLGQKVGEEGGGEVALRLAPEIGNLEALLGSALEGSAPAPALAAALGIGNLQRFTGLGSYGLLEQAIEAAHETDLEALEGRLLKGLGHLAFDRNDYDRAWRSCERARILFQKAGQGTSDLVGEEAYCLQRLGDIALRLLDHDGARARYDEAFSLFSIAGSLLGQASCTRRLGDIAFARLDYDDARSRYEEALRIYQGVGSPLGEANCIRRLGEVDFRRGDLQQAQYQYEHAAPLYRRIGSLLGEAECIQGVGDIALARSDLDGARSRYDEALVLYRRVGNLLGEANCIQGLGDVALRERKRGLARQLIEQALPLFERASQALAIGWCCLRLARLAEGDSRRRHHVAACRKSWLSVGRGDLVSDLDREFPEEAVTTDG